MDEVYKRICDKLGCEPKDIAIPEFDTEDDSWESPFKVLHIFYILICNTVIISSNIVIKLFFNK